LSDGGLSVNNTITNIEVTGEEREMVLAAIDRQVAAWGLKMLNVTPLVVKPGSKLGWNLTR